MASLRTCGSRTVFPVLLTVLAILQAPGAHAQPRRPLISGDLRRLESEFVASKTQPVGDRRSEWMESMPLVGDYVVIDAASNDPRLLVNELRRIGLRNEAVAGRLVSGLLPIASIALLDDVPYLRLARAARSGSSSGSVTSQGDAAMRADVARALFGLDGSGITVGTISDSFNSLPQCGPDGPGPLTGAALDIATGDLPAEGVLVLEDTNSCHDEGRAMIQIIHDVAPGVRQGFHTGWNGEASFARAIEELAGCPAGSQPGCTAVEGFAADIINDDLFYYAEPFFQDGVIAQAVDRVAHAGVSYLTAAGNQGRKSYEAPFRPTLNLGPHNGRLHDFDPGEPIDVSQRIHVPVGGHFTMVLQWDDHYFSLNGDPGAVSDLNLYIRRPDINYVVSSSTEDNIGGDPIEMVNFVNGGQYTDDSGQPLTEFDVQIEQFGPEPRLVKWVAFVGGGVDFIHVLEYDTASSTVVGHMNAGLAMTVGGAAYYDTPPFGVSPPVKEPFSSAGGNRIFFDKNGGYIAPLIRPKPDFTAPHRGNTTFFGYDSDGDGWPNFSGTSASAPHAAGVVALMLQAAGGPGSLTPAEVRASLQSTAIDMDDPDTPGFDVGFDFGTGHGLIDAVAAVLPHTGPSLAADLLQQTVTYGDPISTVTVTARDRGSDLLTLDTWWIADRIGPTGPLPGDLTLVSGPDPCGPAPDFDGVQCIWTLQGTILTSQDDITVFFQVTDQDDLTATATTVLHVKPRPVLVTFEAANPVSVQVTAPGGLSGLFSLGFRVSGFLSDTRTAGKDASSGIPVSAVLSPIGPGTPADGLCSEVPQPVTAAEAGSPSALDVVCAFDQVAVNTYAANITVDDGGYHAASAEDVVVVVDPTLGFTAGGGWFEWPGTEDRTNFGFTVKYVRGKGRGKNDRTPQVQGSLLLVRHEDGVGSHRLKSNALEGLSIGSGSDAEGPFGWASVSGKATFREPDWAESMGDYGWIAYVEDRGQPGSGEDRFWIETSDAAGAVVPGMTLPREAPTHAVPLAGGNLVVPLGSKAGKTDEDLAAGETPIEFALSPGYPNPFNPSTTIRYAVPETAHVRITLYDVTGREVAVLVDGIVESGHHAVTWDATGEASGLYVCRMTTATYAAARTMVLLK